MSQRLKRSLDSSLPKYAARHSASGSNTRTIWIRCSPFAKKGVGIRAGFTERDFWETLTKVVYDWVSGSEARKSCIAHEQNERDQESRKLTSTKSHSSSNPPIGTLFRIFNVIDEFTRELLAYLVRRRIRFQEVILILAELMIQHACPKYVRSDNGPEFIARRLLNGFKTLEVKPVFIEPGSPWENGYCESFNPKIRFELLNAEFFYNLREARAVIEL